MGIRTTAQHAEALVQPANRSLRVTAQHTEALVIPDNRSMRVTLQLIEALVIEDLAQRGPDTATATAATTTLTLAVPAVVEGDLLIAQVAFRGGTGTTVTPPAGWQQRRRDDNGTTVGQIVYTRIADGTEPASYQWTLSSAVDAGGGISAYPGAVVDVDDGTSATGASISAPSVTSSGKRVVVLYAGGSSTGTGNQWTQPTDHAEGRDVGTASGIQVGKSHKGHAGGSTGLQNAASTSNNAKVAAVLALKGAVGLRPRAVVMVVQ